ncbi:MAG: hypothetical protein IJW82_02810 [Clostridia bacterium]|nr:hypothetical protein [Clostridia bacterium]
MVKFEKKKNPENASRDLDKERRKYFAIKNYYEKKSKQSIIIINTKKK